MAQNNYFASMFFVQGFSGDLQTTSGKLLGYWDQHESDKRYNKITTGTRLSMQRSVEQALASLIPRYNGSLPPELVELASSLLALSRSKASNLKAEEEIGRTYACANIACERSAISIIYEDITSD